MKKFFAGFAVMAILLIAAVVFAAEMPDSLREEWEIIDKDGYVRIPLRPEQRIFVLGKWTKANIGDDGRGDRWIEGPGLFWQENDFSLTVVYLRIDKTGGPKWLVLEVWGKEYSYEPHPSIPVCGVVVKRDFIKVPPKALRATLYRPNNNLQFLFFPPAQKWDWDFDIKIQTLDGPVKGFVLVEPPITSISRRGKLSTTWGKLKK